MCVKKASIAVVGTLILAACSQGGDSDQSTSSIASASSIHDSVSSSSGLTQSDVERLEMGLGSADPSQVASVLELVEAVDTVEIAAEMLPEGTEVTIDRGSFVDFGGGYGAVTAALSGTADATVILYLRLVAGVWLVAGTTEPVVVP